MITTDWPHHQAAEQRAVALGLANQVRGQRAEMKRDLKARRRHAAEIIMFPPDYAKTMKVHALLGAIPRVGDVKGARIMRIVGLSPARTIGTITDRQRKQLVEVLARRAWQ